MELYELYQQGITLLEGNNPYQATIPLKKASRIAPEQVSIREALGRAYFHTHRYESAAKEFKAATDLSPTNDYALFCLGRSLQLLGKKEQARGPLALASCMRPERADYRRYRDQANR